MPSSLVHPTGKFQPSISPPLCKTCNNCILFFPHTTHHSPWCLSSCRRDLACCKVVASPCNGALTGNDSFSLLIGGCSCDSSCESICGVKGETVHHKENNKAVSQIKAKDAQLKRGCLGCFRCNKGGSGKCLFSLLPQRQCPHIS